MPHTSAIASRHEQVSRQLRDDLADGRYGQEGRLPSEAQLARQFSVSRPTVARALQSLVEAGLVERRAGSGTFAKPGDIKKHAALTTRVLALLIPDLGNTEIFQIIGGEIASLARVHNYSLIWGGSGEPKLDVDPCLQHAEELCHQFIEHRVSGVFFAPYELVPERDEINRRLAIMLREAGIPVILVDRDFVQYPFRSDFDLVGIDNVAGGYILAQHLLKLGCRRLRFVAYPLSAPSVNARIAGAREALLTSRIEPDADWVRIGALDDKSFVRSLIVGRPDGFICANDHTAALLLRALHQNDVRVPEDVRVVGFDDVNFATLVSPALTTARQPCKELASTAFHAMLERQTEPNLPPRHMMIMPQLVVRESSGPCRHADETTIGSCPTQEVENHTRATRRRYEVTAATSENGMSGS
jgi:DNA-binding LacI/PurR family transcriptional regulator